MTKPDLIKCADGHYRKAIYGLGPYIADYPEQVLLAGIVSGWCVRCIHFPPSVPPSTHSVPSCTGHRTNLDEEETLPCTEQLTLASLEAFTYKELWEDYGIVADIAVCSNTFLHTGAS